MEFPYPFWAIEPIEFSLFSKEMILKAMKHDDKIKMQILLEETKTTHFFCHFCILYISIYSIL